MNIFGITPEQVPELPTEYSKLSQSQRRDVRLRYMALQENKCCYCNKLLSEDSSPEVLSKLVNEKLFPEHFFSYPIHLHHHHDTDLTIGTIHAYCNAVSFQYDNI